MQSRRTVLKNLAVVSLAFFGCSKKKSKNKNFDEGEEMSESVTNVGFNPSIIGLPGERITDAFNIPRNNCFHSGIDISSSRTPMPYSAGIWGKVAGAGFGVFNTISIIPMGNPNVVVQYLHNSNIRVSTGTIVAPWTIIGDTGEFPPNLTNGIHLHLQVFKRSGTSLHTCWSRNYINPSTFSLGNPAGGRWIHTSFYNVGPMAVTSNRTMTITSDNMGAQILLEATEDFIYGQYDLRLSYRYRGTITGRRGNSFQVNFQLESCHRVSGFLNPDCRKRAVTFVSNVECILNSVNSLYMESPGNSPMTWTRVGIADDLAGSNSVSESPMLQDVSIDTKFNPFSNSVSSDSIHLEGITQEFDDETSPEVI